MFETSSPRKKTRALRSFNDRNVCEAMTGSVVELEGGDEDVARNLDASDRLHLLLALLLLLEQLALAGDVTAVALGEHILALRLHRLAGDDLPTDCGLDRHVEHLARDQLAQLLAHPASVLEGLVTMDNRAERVGAFTVEQQVNEDEVALMVALQLVVEAGIPLCAALHLIEEVDDHLSE